MSESQQTVHLLDVKSERTESKALARPHKRANDLDGKTWTRYSISIWSDIRKIPEEIKLGHPAIFPFALVARLIRCFTAAEDKVILDPFVGIGSTAIAAQLLGKTGIGLEVHEKFAQKARNRPVTQDLLQNTALGERIIHTADARGLLDYVAPESVDLVITSPPYWDIHLQARSADYKETRSYGPSPYDLGKIPDYSVFLAALKSIFRLVYQVMRPGKYCCVIVMDIRKKDTLYPFHMDVAAFMQDIGFMFDDLIIWDRRQEYNNMRPLGYPYRFRVNKAHEYILIFQKPNKR